MQQRENGVVSVHRKRPSRVLNFPFRAMFFIPITCSLSLSFPVFFLSLYPSFSLHMQTQTHAHVGLFADLTRSWMEALELFLLSGFLWRDGSGVGRVSC